MAITSTSYEEGQSGNHNGRPQSEAARLRSEMMPVNLLSFRYAETTRRKPP